MLKKTEGQIDNFSGEGPSELRKIVSKDSLCSEGRPQKSWLFLCCREFPEAILFLTGRLVRIWKVGKDMEGLEGCVSTCSRNSVASGMPSELQDGWGGAAVSSFPVRVSLEGEYGFSGSRDDSSAFSSPYSSSSSAFCFHRQSDWKAKWYRNCSP